jgi:hypothetical protein
MLAKVAKTKLEIVFSSSRLMNTRVRTSGSGFEFRAFLHHEEGGHRISPWHDLPLKHVPKEVDFFTAFYEIPR